MILSSIPHDNEFMRRFVTLAIAAVTVGDLTKGGVWGLTNTILGSVVTYALRNI